MGSLIFFFLLYLILALVNLSHPIRVAFLLIFLSIIISLFSLKLLCSWFFYLLVLVFLGGVIILIIYISTLATNEKFYVFRLKNKRLISILLILRIIFINLIVFPSFDKIPPHNFIPNILYEPINFNSILFLMLYLLLTIICVVKLVKFEVGPLIMRL